jgi:CspA family cold shock protein
MEVLFAVVLNFNHRGFGFLLPDGSRQQLFFHVKDVVGRLTLREGDRVSFSITPDPKGDRATNVRLLEPEAQS